MIFSENDLRVIATIIDAENRMSNEEIRLALSWFIKKYQTLMTTEAAYSCVNCECAVCKRNRSEK